MSNPTYKKRTKRKNLRCKHKSSPKARRKNKTTSKLYKLKTYSKNYPDIQTRTTQGGNILDFFFSSK
jgi:hypothetical protein